MAGRLDLHLFDEVGIERRGGNAGAQIGCVHAVHIELVLGADAPSTEMPPLRLSWLAPGASVTSDWKSRPFGIIAMRSAWMFVAAVLCLTSIVGELAVTCTTSVSPPTARTKSTLRSWPTATKARLWLGLNPANVARISYWPGASAGKRYTPLASAVVAITPVEPLASTVAPGRTAPDASLTTPSIAPRVSCAHAGARARRSETELRRSCEHLPFLLGNTKA